jgi:hypothetical protein
MRKKKIMFFVLGISLIIIPILSSTTQADSWVLWEKTDSIKTDGNQNIYWEIVHAYPVKKQCIQEMIRTWWMMRNQAIEDKEKSDTISEVKEVRYSRIIISFKQPKEILSIAKTYYCLPGTSDPQEEK